MIDLPQVLGASLPPVEVPRVTVVTAHALEVLTVANIKTHLRVTHSNDDTYLGLLLDRATEYCERYQNRAYLTQTLEYRTDAFPSVDYISLPRPPLQSVTSLKYTDEDDVEHTVSSGDYHVDTYSEPGRIVLKVDKDWPDDDLIAVNGIVVKYVAGWTAAANVPTSIQHAMYLLIAHWYEHREGVYDGAAVSTLPLGIENLLAFERITRFA